MRLISPQEQAKILKDPKAEVTTFYVEKCKNSVIPKHFLAEDNKDKKQIKINGVVITVGRNKERSEYCAFCTGNEETKQCFYVRNHAFLDHAKEYVTFERPVKPKPEPKPKKEKATKAEGAKDETKPADGKAAKTGKSSAASEKAAREAAADTGVA